MKKLLILVTLMAFMGFYSNCGDNCDAAVSHICDVCGSDSKACTTQEDALDDQQSKDSYKCDGTDKQLEAFEKLEKKDMDCNMDGEIGN